MNRVQLVRGMLGLLLIGAGAGEALAQSRVFRSAGATAPRRYPVGTPLPAGARIVLRPGETVVITQREFARTFRGPGTFVARMTDPAGLLGSVTGSASGSGGRSRPSNRFGGPPQVRPEADGALSRFYICPDHPRCPR